MKTQNSIYAALPVLFGFFVMVHKNDLTVLIRIHRLYTVSRGLRLIAGDRDFLPDQMVHQCGFSDIGPADQRGKPRFKFLVHSYSVLRQPHYG